MFKNTNIKNLGVLADKEKLTSCWAPGTLSGSRVGRIMEEPKQVLAEWLNDTPTIDPASNPIVAEKMAIGTYMEPVIVQLAKDKLGIDINVDKNTYQFGDKPWYFNIDGVSSDGSVIYEIKNTETTSVDVLVERYKYQATWYKMLTGCDKIVFIFFIRGYKLRTVEFIPSELDIADMIDKVEKFMSAYEAGTNGYDLINWGNEPTEPTEAVALTNQEAKQKLADLIAMQDDIKWLESQCKELKEYFGEAIGESGAYVDPDTGNRVAVVSSTRKGGIDVEETMKQNQGITIFYKPDYTTKTIRITKGKVKGNN